MRLLESGFRKDELQFVRGSQRLFATRVGQ
jgi:hypothetical protein